MNPVTVFIRVSFCLAQCDLPQRFIHELHLR